MRTVLLFFLVALTALSTTAQSIYGTYSNKWEASSGEAIEYSLTLLENGNFVFISTRTHLDAIPDKKLKAKGTWQLDGHLLVLITATNEDSENTLEANLDMNKAKFKSVSPRNPDFNLVKPSLKFYESNVFYAKDMELIKTDASVTSLD